jgi:hypothetical protein
MALKKSELDSIIKVKTLFLEIQLKTFGLVAKIRCIEIQ